MTDQIICIFCGKKADVTKQGQSTMVICNTSEHIDWARREYPDMPILCEDTGTVYFPEGDTAHMPPHRIARAKQEPGIVIFEIIEPED